jgi:hypothetical protein
MLPNFCSLAYFSVSAFFGKRAKFFEEFFSFSGAKIVLYLYDNVFSVLVFSFGAGFFCIFITVHTLYFRIISGAKLLKYYLPDFSCFYLSSNSPDL